MSSSNIALRVYSGSLEGGFNPTPIVSVGKAPRKFAPFTPVLVKEDRSWSIIHDHDYTAYTLYTKEYPSTDGQPRQMLICMLLPPTLFLADDATPLELLNAALTLFGGTVPTSPVDNSEFSVLLDEYTLTERVASLPVMKGQNVAAFRPKDKNQLNALMLYSRYPALDKVARLELGMNCESTIDLPLPGNKPQKQQVTPTPPPPPPAPKTTNKTKVIHKERKEKGTKPLGTAKTQPQQTSEGKKTPVDNTPKPPKAPEQKKKKGFSKPLLLIGAAVATLALLFIFIPKNKGSEGGENPVDVDVANIESNQEDPEAGQKLIADARKNSVQNAENSKTKETGKNNENVETTTASNQSPTMSKTQAIEILLGGQGDKTAARNALSQQERNDIETIRALNNQSNEAKQIISQLRAGSLSIAAAKTKMQKLKPGGGNGGNGGNGGDGGNGGGTMSKTTAIRILLGENLGKTKDAEKVLGAEAKVVKNVRSIYNSLPVTRKMDAEPIIANLKRGAITPAAAAQKLENINNGR